MFFCFQAKIFETALPYNLLSNKDYLDGFKSLAVLLCDLKKNYNILWDLQNLWNVTQKPQ